MTKNEFDMNPFGGPTTSAPAPVVGQPNSATPELDDNPFGGPGIPRVAPLAPDQNELDVNPWKAGSGVAKKGLGILTTVGKVLQPFAAPQQIIFGAIGGLEDLITQKGAEAAAATFARGAHAAAGYLTYGLPAALDKTKADARDTYINGYELAKKANLPDYLAKPLGVAADFFVDVPILGKAAKATGLARALDISSRVDQAASVNMARSFVKPGGVASNPADWDIPGMMKFATRVAAAPLSTAPIRDIVTAVPQGMREEIAGRIAGAIEGNRMDYIQNGQQTGRSAPLGKTVAQLAISRFGYVRGLPTMDGKGIQTLRNTGLLRGTGIAREMEGDIYAAQAEASKIAYMSSDAKVSYDKLTRGLSQDTKDKFDDIAYRLLDWDSAASYSAAHTDLENLATTLGDPAFKQQALEGLWKAASLDAYTGLLRYRNGTLGLDKTSGNFQGLRKFERDTFGQPKTANPVAPTVAARALADRRAGAPVRLPEEAMHFRRAYMLNTRPHDVINKLSANPRPAQVMHVDDTLLSDAMHTWLTRGGVPTSPAIQSTASQLATDFKAWYTNPAQMTPFGNPEPQAMMQFLTSKGYTTQQGTDLLNVIGNRWHQNGVVYRPPNEQVVELLRKHSDSGSASPTLTGSNTPVLGNSNRPLGSRADLPEWYMESMEQIKDIGELLDQNIRIGTKQYVNRSVVQATYDFLKNEGGILTTAELGMLPRGANGVHQNWRMIDESLAQRLKGIDDPHSVYAKDTPFDQNMYIPAAYHDLLTSFSTIQDTGMKNAMLQLINTSFKAHKVANPAAIARDIATNFRLADDLGVNPAQLTKGVAQATELRNRAIRGDGAFDTNAAITVNGVKITWQEVLDHGGFIHGNFVTQEIDDSYRVLRSNLANQAGSPIQRVAAAFIDHADRVRRVRDEKVASGNVGAIAGKGLKTAGAAVTDLVTGLGGPVTKKLTDIKGEIDTVFKLGVYIQKRAQGMTGEKAAQHADEMFFNYQNQPIMVDFLRKNGISPFAAFQFMASGRFMRSLYENPYAIERWYRLPQSMTAGNQQAQGEIENTAPDYMAKQLWMPIPAFRGKDQPMDVARNSQGDMMMFNLNLVMPESAFFNWANGDAVSNWVPPIVSAAIQIGTGVGYGGVPLYAGGGSLEETAARGPTGRMDAARGIVKGLHQFGATPWAPGTPMADRMAKGIIDSFVPASQMVDNPFVQEFLKTGQEGIFAAQLQNAPIVTRPIGAQAPNDMGYRWTGDHKGPNVPYGPLRALGLSSAPVTGLTTQPGSAKNETMGGKYEVGNLRATMMQEIKKAGADPKAIQIVLARWLPQVLKEAADLRKQQEFEQKQSVPYYNNKK